MSAADPLITLVVAADRAGGIGKDGGLPWRLPDDLKFFKQVTADHPLVMGRRTHESIGRALPGRANIVTSRDPSYRPAEGCVSVTSIDEAIAMAVDSPGGEEVMVIGGAEIFNQVLARAGRVYLTRVHDVFPADTFFEPLDEEAWKEVWREDREADASHAHARSFICLERT